MTPDQSAIHDAFANVAADGSKHRRLPGLFKKLERMKRRRGISERTILVIDMAIEKLEAGWFGSAFTILREEDERLR